MAPSLKARSKLMFFSTRRTACTTPSTSTHWPSSVPLSSAVEVISARSKAKGLPNQVRPAGPDDGSIIPGGAYARYFNQVARLKGTAGGDERHKDSSGRVGDKKRRPPLIDVKGS